ncbi:MAG: hypothetical protein DWH91_04295 [Planctomycetota bacterium]|nr:MAG: hypothetical protein DWH91_04295 [Planctomycetota bacterium]
MQDGKEYILLPQYALCHHNKYKVDRHHASQWNKGKRRRSPTLLTPFLWGGMVGYYWDAALATQYIRARHYQPAIARWISLDPIGFAGGDANLFRYVGNSPTSGGTAMRISLTATAYGQWQVAIARSVLDSLTLARMYEGRKGRVLSHVPTMFPHGANSFGGWCSHASVDPMGLEKKHPMQDDPPEYVGQTRTINIPKSCPGLDNIGVSCTQRQVVACGWLWDYWKNVGERQCPPCPVLPLDGAAGWPRLAALSLPGGGSPRGY